MSKKHKQSKKAKSSKRTKIAAEIEEEPDTTMASSINEVHQLTKSASQPEVAGESQQAPADATPAPLPPPVLPAAEVADLSQHEVAVAPATPVAPSNSVTRSEAAKANIKEGLRLHQIAGRPTKAQLILVFGKAGYLRTWPKRTEKFGITPETFQAALAKSVPAVPLTPVAKPAVEKT